VATEGWADTSSLRADELGLRFQDAGVSAIIFTDIARDGMLSGVNITQTLALAAAVSTPVIASGGIGGIEDLRTLREEAAGRLAGVIVGRALYDGRLRLSEAVELLA